MSQYRNCNLCALGSRALFAFNWQTLIAKPNQLLHFYKRGYLSSLNIYILFMVWLGIAQCICFLCLKLHVVNRHRNTGWHDLRWQWDNFSWMFSVLHSQEKKCPVGLMMKVNTNPPPPPPLPLFPNLSGISVRRGSAKFFFQLCIFFFNKNVQAFKKR